MFVLLTGATGFVGGHVTSQFLQAGHKIRAIVRPGRSERLLSTFPNAGERLEIFELALLHKDDFTDALKNIEAVIHVASPIGSKGETKKEMFDGGYHGTVRIVEAAIAQGVKRIVVTGSILSLVDGDFHQAFGKEPLSPKNYGNFDETYDYEAAPSAFDVYMATKTLADKHIWKLQNENPDVDMTVLIVPTVLGPFVENHPSPTSTIDIVTDSYIYDLITDQNREYPQSPMSPMADVRDIAKAHVLSLTSLPSKENKRLLLCAKHVIWKEVVDLIKEKRPELAHRLPRDDATPHVQMSAPFDLSLTEKVLGLKEYIPWQDTILASIDEGLKLEKV